MKKLFGAIFLSVISIFCMAQTNDPLVFGWDDSGMIGIVWSNDIIQYYYFETDTWIPYEPRFVLPNGWKKVFSFSDGCIGVLVNDKIQFYQCEGNTWKRFHPEIDFTLPRFYNAVFGMWDELFVIMDNKLNVYQYTYNEIWEINPGFNFALPFGYKDVFGTYIDGIAVLGIVFNRRVIFYKWSEEFRTWISLPEFPVPNDAKTVFGMPLDGFGLVFDDGVNFKIEFYQYQNSGWTKKANADFLTK